VQGLKRLTRRYFWPKRLSALPPLIWINAFARANESRMEGEFRVPEFRQVCQIPVAMPHRPFRDLHMDRQIRTGNRLLNDNSAGRSGRFEAELRQID